MRYILPLLLLSACALPAPRISTADGSCAGVLLSPARILTAAHCARPTAAVTCDGQRVRVEAWELHPKWQGAAHDLAVGTLSAPLACFEPVTLAAPRLGAAWYRGQGARIVDVGDGVIEVDIGPRKFCRGSSGAPVQDSAERVVGIVSRGESGECSERARAASVDEWVRERAPR